MKILFLDDSPRRHNLFDQRLRGEHEIEHVWDVIELECELESSRFGLVCMDHDLGLPMDGRDAARVMAMMRFNVRPRVVIHSHNPVGAAEMKQILEGAGFAVVLHPFDLE